MRILKPGFSHYDDETRYTCHTCGCEFLASGKDIKDDTGKPIKDEDKHGVFFITCPWCKNKFSVVE